MSAGQFPGTRASTFVMPKHQVEVALGKERTLLLGYLDPLCSSG